MSNPYYPDGTTQAMHDAAFQLADDDLTENEYRDEDGIVVCADCGRNSEDCECGNG